MNEKSTCQYGKFSSRFLLHLYNRTFTPTKSSETHPRQAPLPHPASRVRNNAKICHGVAPNAFFSKIFSLLRLIFPQIYATIFPIMILACDACVRAIFSHRRNEKETVL